MAKKGKMKISKIKRNNQTTNKMKKQGKLRLQRHRSKVQKQRQPSQPEIEYSSESEASGDEWADMLDEEEQKYIMGRLAKQPGLLSHVPPIEEENKNSKKRKRVTKPKVLVSDSGADSEGSASDVEDKYEREMSERPVKKMRSLLPIKTKLGILERVEECDDLESENDDDVQPKSDSKIQLSDQESDDSGMEANVEEEAAPDGEVVTTVQLLVARQNQLKHDKLRIGALCSSLLETPEKKLKNLYPILYLMEDKLKDGALNLHSVRKLATLSAFEVFKDILPDYQIRHQDYSNVKLKKETLALYKYEKELLEFYKRYLQRLEKAATVLKPKKGDNRKIDKASISLGLVSLQCMCGMLEARPHFNYSTNIAQSVVPALDCRLPEARTIVTRALVNVFADDKKGDITLVIVRLINQLVKRRGERLQPSALDCLLSLKIRDVDLDTDADLKRKKKQEEKHKKRIVNLSKKEKKRAKKLKEVERELLETEAQENEMARRKQLTEVTKTVFHIYFRLLKSAPQSRLLTSALNGLAKFTHVINLEYYSDLMSILARLVSDELVGRSQRLLCVKTVLATLTAAGDAINVDPARFHRYLYCGILSAHAGSSEEDAKIVLECVWQIFGRVRRVSSATLQAFAKRLATFALQLQHNGSLAALLLLHQLAQQSKAVSSLLETDMEPTGSGRFDPFLESPEHCNAHSALLYELCALTAHYHPAVREMATVLLHSRTTPAEFNKLSPVEVFEQYDGSQMAFKPAIPPPKSSSQASKHTNEHAWAQPNFKQLCDSLEFSVDMNIYFGDIKR